MTETHDDDDDHDDNKEIACTIRHSLFSAAVAAYLDEDPSLLHFTDQQNKTGCLLRERALLLWTMVRLGEIH